MRKNILIPTDFTIDSLMLLKHAIVKNINDELIIHFLYSTKLPDSITDLLFYPSELKFKKYADKDFIRACNILKNEYAQNIQLMSFKVFHGCSQTAFDRMVDVENISEIYLPRTYKFKMKKDSIDPVPYIINSKVNVCYVDWKEQVFIEEKGILAELFFALNETT